MIKRALITILELLVCLPALHAQIGYQVSLLNSATGEPRANEDVKVKIEITDSDNKVICSEEKDVTSNEFGILSLSVGNDKTFENVDWSKAPFYVSATIDDVLIGKSQILSVPIAEAARTIIGVSPESISGHWIGVEDISMTISFNTNSQTTGTCVITGDKGSTSYPFEKEGNIIWVYGNTNFQIMEDSI